MINARLKVELSGGTFIPDEAIKCCDLAGRLGIAAIEFRANGEDYVCSQNGNIIKIRENTEIFHFNSKTKLFYSLTKQTKES